MFVKCLGLKTERFIDKVELELHETFRTPKRTLTKAPFELTMTGWGTFDIPIKIYWKKCLNLGPEELGHMLSFENKLTQKTFSIKIHPSILAKAK